MRRKVPRIDAAWTSASVEVVVHFCEVDAMRVAWHGHYARYCESAREAFFDRCGLGYDDLQARGWAAPVVHLALDFLLQRLIHYQRRDLERLQQLAQQAASSEIDRRARELVQEALGSARAHLEILEELARSGHPPGDGAPSLPSAQPASHAH